MREISQKRRRKKKSISPHKVTQVIFLPQLLYKWYQIGFQPSVTSKRIRKCCRQSLCLGLPQLVHAHERGESQDQVSAGQGDVRASCAPIGCSVGWNERHTGINRP